MYLYVTHVMSAEISNYSSAALPKVVVFKIQTPKIGKVWVFEGIAL